MPAARPDGQERATGVEVRQSAASAPDAIPPGGEIRGLAASLVPLREFPLRKWFYVTPLWYYHAPALTHQLRRDPTFYELVDPLLRELCRLLAQAGLFTTPSCQGHFYPRERFEQIWAELLRDAESIRRGGLIVRDSETDREYLFIDSVYSIPWPDFDTFYRDANAHQNQGYIGIAVPPERSDLLERLEMCRLEAPAVRLAYDEPLSAMLGHALFGVHVHPHSPDERDRAWSAVTAFLASALRL